MKNIKALFLLSMVCLVTGDDNGMLLPGPPNPVQTNSTHSSSTPITSPLTSTTIKPTAKPNTTTTSTTSKPTTTILPTTSTPNSTTTSPKTTTPITTSTTTSTTTSPTTATPTTSTTTATTSTAKPTPSPPLTPGNWSANYTNTNRICLVLAAALKIVVPYKEGNVSKNYEVNVPPRAEAQGSCDVKDLENITLKFGKVNSISFGFQKDKDSKKYDVDSILITLSADVPSFNVSQLILIHETKEFSTPISNSYKCMQERVLNLVSVDKSVNYVGQLHVSHFQMQAFKNSTEQKFDEALNCESETPDVVPIAVGCALAALVIVVLIAYLVGRRRSQARGYLSM